MSRCRFQDPDESAHYEYLNRKEGVHVEYCAKPFRNDLTASSSLLKNIKRMMAAEFSRELSVKVYAGKCRALTKGVSVGATACYGLRRMLTDASGRDRGLLERGEHKFCHTDRVVFVPGPAHERAVVRWIFREVADKRTCPTAIARALNARGEPWRPGKAWTPSLVRTMLADEKCIGNLVYNRTSTKLRVRTCRNESGDWVRIEGAIQPVIDKDLFRRARALLDTLSRRTSKPAGLGRLRRLLDREGTLNSGLINAEPHMPSSNWYCKHFGGLNEAYRQIGFKAKRDTEYLRTYWDRWTLRDDYRQQVAEGLEALGILVERESGVIMSLDGRLRLGASWPGGGCGKGEPKWLAQIHVFPHPDLVLVASLNDSDTGFTDHQILSGGQQGMWVNAVRPHGRRTIDRFDHLLPALAHIAQAATARH